MLQTLLVVCASRTCCFANGTFGAGTRSPIASNGRVVFEYTGPATAVVKGVLYTPVGYPEAPVSVALGICRRWHFDEVSMTILADQTNSFGYAITAAVIAGGSKASVKLFHDVFNTMSDAERVHRQFAGVHDRRHKSAGRFGARSALVPGGAN